MLLLLDVVYYFCLANLVLVNVIEMEVYCDDFHTVTCSLHYYYQEQGNILQNFLIIRKHSLPNHQKILEKYFLCTTYMMIYVTTYMMMHVACLNLQPRNNVLIVAKGSICKIKNKHVFIFQRWVVNYCVVDDLNMLNLCMQYRGNISSRFFLVILKRIFQRCLLIVACGSQTNDCMEYVIRQNKALLFMSLSKQFYYMSDD